VAGYYFAVGCQLSEDDNNAIKSKRFRALMTKHLGNNGRIPRMTDKYARAKSGKWFTDFLHDKYCNEEEGRRTAPLRARAPQATVQGVHSRLEWALSSCLKFRKPGPGGAHQQPITSNQQPAISNQQ
jgi:hypothetical protein